MKKYNLKNFEEYEYIDFIQEFYDASNSTISDELVDKMIDESTPLIVFKKDSDEQWIFLNIPEVAEVVGMPIIEKVTKKDQMEIHSYYAKFDEIEDGLIYIGNELNLVDFNLFKDAIKIRVLADFFKAGQMLYQKIEGDFDYTPYNTIHETGEFELLMTKDASSTLFLITKGENRWMVPILQDANDEISLFFGVGNNSPIKRKIGKYPGEYNNDSGKVAMEVIEIIENVKQGKEEPRITQINMVDEKADDLAVVEEDSKLPGLHAAL